MVSYAIATGSNPVAATPDDLTQLAEYYPDTIAVDSSLPVRQAGILSVITKRCDLFQRLPAGRQGRNLLLQSRS